METHHKLFFSDSRKMSKVKNESVNLIVTSPAYPMIEMWDTLYNDLNPKIGQALALNQGKKAFEWMHKELDKTWKEALRVLKPGGIACINIGDATRTINGQFQLYSNHSRITRKFKELGFHVLPMILWHKKTNAPNKFMGSGMLPAGAYVTLEHEYILVFRKGSKRVFKTPKEKQLRKESAFFWEERNKWFSDIWFDLTGVPQNIRQLGTRNRSAAFPFELAYRLICMFSVYKDTVLDPFLGTGTTALSCMATGRNSIGFEIDPVFQKQIINQSINALTVLNNKIFQRLTNHIQFIRDFSLKKGEMKYQNLFYKFPVMTRQETLLHLPFLKIIKLMSDYCISTKYSTDCKMWHDSVYCQQREMRL